MTFAQLLVINFALMPMPLGAALALRFPNRAHSVGVGLLAFYVLVEALQYVRGGGRIASVQDVLICTAGAVLAASLVALIARPWIIELHRATDPATPAAPQTSARPVIAWAVVPILVVSTVLTGTVLTNDSSTAEPALDAAAPNLAASTCGLEPGEWVLPDVAPLVDSWVGMKVQLPNSSTFGPASSADGQGTCFAHNPTGALFATAWQLHEEIGQVAGFRFLGGYPELVDVEIAYLAGDQLVAVPVKVEWSDGDWISTTTPTQERNLASLAESGFTAWNPA